MKILVIVAQVGFRDEEYQVPYEFFREKGISVDIASEEKGQCIGKYGLTINADLGFKEISIGDYDAMVLVGGSGSKNLVDNQELRSILLNAAKQNKVIASICYSGITLAEAGLLKGKKATVWDKDGENSKRLKTNGAIYINEPVVVDGLIVTADGPSSAKEFAEEIVRLCQQ